MEQSHPFQEEMMHRIQGWTGLRAAVIALGLVAWTATGATAAPLSYTTSGQVNTTTGVTGTNVISFVPLEQQEFGRPQHGPNECKPGELRRLAPGAGRIDNLQNTPFQISFLPASYGGRR